MKGSKAMKNKEWNTLNDKEKKNRLVGKLPSRKQKDYAYAIADALKIKRPKGDAYDFYKFIANNKEKSKSKFKAQSHDLDVETAFMYIPAMKQEEFRSKFECLSGKHGIYAFLGENDELYYIGKSNNLFSRIPTSYNERRKSAPIKTIAYYEVDNMADVNILEIVLISENKPMLNGESNSEEYPTMFHSNIDIAKDFKRLPYDFQSLSPEELSKYIKKQWEHGTIYK